jgi:hypothetical protein
MPSCSALDWDKLRRSSMISSWIWSIISRVVTVLGSPGLIASQFKKSPCLNCTTQFLTVAYNGASSRNVSFRMARLSFGELTCRKKTWWQIGSRCCWSRERRLTCFLSASQEKTSNAAHEETSLSNDTIYAFLRHQEVGRAKDLSAPSRM